jgi:hypothetical protein
MKEANKQRLYADLDRIANQIGILAEEKPKLVLDRKEYHALLVNDGQTKRAAGYGECNWNIRTIFLDASRRSFTYRTYRKRKGNYLSVPNNGKDGYSYSLHSFGSTEHKEVKATYKTKLHCLVHELVHYRFGYMNHNKKFEDRIKEILRGRTFPKKHIDLKGKLSDV